MTKTILLIIVTILLCMTIDHCQALNETSSNENRTGITNKPWVYHGSYQRRLRRQIEDPLGNIDTAATVLSILPLDRIGTIIGQIMATGLKEMLNPDVGRKLVNVLENQAPLLLTSLFTNLYSTLRVPARPASTTTTNLTSSSVSMNNNAIKQLSNSSTTSEILNTLRRPTMK